MRAAPAEATNVETALAAARNDGWEDLAAATADRRIGGVAPAAQKLEQLVRGLPEGSSAGLVLAEAHWLLAQLATSTERRLWHIAKAITLFEASAPLAGTTSLLRLAECLVDRARLRCALGLFDDAVADSGRAIEILRFNLEQPMRAPCFREALKCQSFAAARVGRATGLRGSGERRPALNP